jgi:hypothetical protein
LYVSSSNSRNRLVSVPVDPGPPLSLGSPRDLFSLDDIGLVGWPAGFDVDGSGQRFLMVREPGAGPPQSALIVVQNWLSEFPGKP